MNIIDEDQRELIDSNMSLAELLFDEDSFGPIKVLEYLEDMRCRVDVVAGENRNSTEVVKVVPSIIAAIDSAIAIVPVISAQLRHAIASKKQ